ncbi:hypothetical protein [Pelagibius sp.]|uniref:hypothetical protein n=1 Tax=Pelagibius sp. TaxID=1931238 RepID=UPI003BB0EE45
MSTDPSAAHRGRLLIVQNHIGVYIKNEGLAAAIAPFIRFEVPDGSFGVSAVPPFVQRVHRDKKASLNSLRDFVLHSGDDVRAGSLQLPAAVALDQLLDRYRSSGRSALKDPELWSFGYEVNDQGIASIDEPLLVTSIAFTLGAENAVAVDDRKSYQKTDLIDLTVSNAKSELLRYLPNH